MTGVIFLSRHEIGEHNNNTPSTLRTVLSDFASHRFYRTASNINHISPPERTFWIQDDRSLGLLDPPASVNMLFEDRGPLMNTIPGPYYLPATTTLPPQPPLFNVGLPVDHTHGNQSTWHTISKGNLDTTSSIPSGAPYLIPCGSTWRFDMPSFLTTCTNQTGPNDLSVGLPIQHATHLETNPNNGQFTQANTHTGTNTNTNTLANTNIISAQLADGTWLCTVASCHRKFKRHQELSRHHRSMHQQLQLYFCRVAGCRRGRGFSRKDKRDDHERKGHRGAVVVSHLSFGFSAFEGYVAGAN